MGWRRPATGALGPRAATVSGRSVLPMASHALPMRADLIPSVGDPVSAPVLVYIAAGNPRIRMAVPIPVAGRPDVAVARRGSPLLAYRGRGHVGVASGGYRAGTAGGEAQGDQHCSGNSIHARNSSTRAHLTTQVGVSRTVTMPPVKRKLH